MIKNIKTLLFIIFFISACSFFKEPPSVKPFLNKGKVSLSKKNPFISSNQFLKDYSYFDSNLASFLKKEGLPDYMELRQVSSFPVDFYLYYEKKEKFFKGIIYKNTWIISDSKQIKKLKTRKKKRERKDTIYKVKKDGETLKSITKHYTGSASLLDSISRINNLNKNTPLKKDTKIKIPSYMLKK